MNIIQLLLKELEQETTNTRIMLERVPGEDFEWQPHPKSMKVRSLATHLADLGNWIGLVLNTTELDFAKSDFKEEKLNDTNELLHYFDRATASGIASLQQANLEQLAESWTLRNGDYIIQVFTKYEFLRTVLAQMIHHRAQLGVFLRLLNVPIPGFYGPSADDLEARQAMGVA